MRFFITFEGIEGCGKTTQINHLASFLEKKGQLFLLTREPGGTKLGEKIREILLLAHNDQIAPWAELFLYLADRVQHYHQIILPALQEDKIVLCDRFIDATLAYQGFGRQLDLNWLEEIHLRSMGKIKPNLTFLLDLPPEEGLKRAWLRIAKQKIKEDRFEKEGLDFHKRVREGYLFLAQREPERFVILNGLQDENSLHQEILRHLPQELYS
ncbi:MAG: dTMP kinase [Thermodesulfobacteriota bacterium]